jgi:3-oxoacyl-[acyl-carrier-protein] synthase-1
MEAHAFHAVFGDAGAPVTSMKGYFGHTLGAAGIIEAALCLMAIRDKTIPASVGLERLGVSKPIHVLREKVVLERLERVVTVKSGFGGVNAALAMAGSHPYD